MLRKDKWYKCSFEFQLKEDLEADEGKVLDIAGTIGKVIGVEGLIADIKVVEPLIEDDYPCPEAEEGSRWKYIRAVGPLMKDE